MVSLFRVGTCATFGNQGGQVRQLDEYYDRSEYITNIAAESGLTRASVV